MKHRVAVTVSEPDHPSVSMRKETKEKFVRVTANDKEGAIQRAIQHYKRQGYKVHGAEHVGTVKEEVDLDEAGAFSYGAKPPRKGSFAHNAMMKRKEQEKSQKPIEPKDQMVGAAKVVKEDELDEAIKLNTKVRIHAPGKDYHDKVGHVGEIRHGVYKGAPKTYTVDYDGKSVQLDKKNIKLHNEEVEQIDELSIEKLAAYKKKAGEQASQANKEGDIKKADKRFSGIVKATNKQFAAAVKKEEVEVSEERKSDPVPSVYAPTSAETKGTYHIDYHGKDKDGNKQTKTYKLKANDNHHAQSKAMKIARSEFPHHISRGASTTKFFKEELEKFSDWIQEASCGSKTDMIKKAVMKMREEIEAETEDKVEQLEEATLAYHVKKASDAKERGDDKKFAYHMENARTARYSMTGKEMLRNRHHLDKYNELRNGK